MVVFTHGFATLIGPPSVALALDGREVELALIELVLGSLCGLDLLVGEYLARLVPAVLLKETDFIVGGEEVLDVSHGLHFAPI